MGILMKHRHSGRVKYRTKRGRILTRQRPLHKRTYKAMGVYTKDREIRYTPSEEERQKMGGMIIHGQIPEVKAKGIDVYNNDIIVRTRTGEDVFRDRRPSMSKDVIQITEILNEGDFKEHLKNPEWFDNFYTALKEAVRNGEVTKNGEIWGFSPAPIGYVKDYL